MTAAHCELSLQDQCAETAPEGACAPSSGAPSPPQPIAMAAKLKIKSTLRFIATPSQLFFGKTSVAEGIVSAYHPIKGLPRRAISLG